MQNVHFYAIDRPSPIERTRPVSSRLAAGAAPRILSSKMEEISLRAACHKKFVTYHGGRDVGFGPPLAIKQVLTFDFCWVAEALNCLAATAMVGAWVS